MKKPAKFNTYLDAMYKEACRWSFCEVMEEWGINEQELNECEEFESYIRHIDEIPEQKTCHIECFCHSALYDSYRCDVCGIELTEPITVVGFDWQYCPNCGAKVVEDEETREV